MLRRAPATIPSAVPRTPDATASPWWNVCTTRNAPRAAGSYGLGGVSIEIHGGPNEGAAATSASEAAATKAQCRRVVRFMILLLVNVRCLWDAAGAGYV